MKRTKENKGITLVALIITIIVLLILAVVTISAVNEGSLFAHANNAATTYSKAQEEENTMISSWLTELGKHDGVKTMSVGEELASLMNEASSGNVSSERMQEIAARAAELGFSGESDEMIGYEASDSNYRTRMYLYNINVLMKVNSTTNEFVYIEETETSEYNTARNAMNFLDVLNNKFIVANKTVAEISEMSDAELESYVLDGVDYIDSFNSFADTDELCISVDIGIGSPQYNINHDETHFTSVEFEQ